MGFDVNVEFKRSMLAVIMVAAATVVACFKIIDGTVWLSIVTGVYGTYFTTRTIEEAKKAKNGNGLSYDEKIMAENASRSKTPQT